jgi:hypothetical protein
MEKYNKKLDDVSKDYEEKLAQKELKWEEFPGQPGGY